MLICQWIIVAIQCFVLGQKIYENANKDGVSMLSVIFGYAIGIAIMYGAGGYSMILP